MDSLLSLKSRGLRGALSAAPDTLQTYFLLLENILDKQYNKIETASIHVFANKEQTFYTKAMPGS